MAGSCGKRLQDSGCRGLGTVSGYRLGDTKAGYSDSYLNANNIHPKRKPFVCLNAAGCQVTGLSRNSSWVNFKAGPALDLRAKETTWVLPQEGVNNPPLSAFRGGGLLCLPTSSEEGSFLLLTST